MKGSIRNVIIVSVLLFNIGCDQITKNVARDHIEYGEKISIVSTYVTLTKIENTGAFLSLGNRLPNVIKIPLLTILPTLFLIGVLTFILRKQKIPMSYAIPIAFILGGGIGNLYDRILHGSVTDFLHMDFILFQTGIFNMADVSIMVGSFWLLATQLNLKKDKHTGGI